MRLVIIIITTILLAGCEYRYRYECQDPANWGKESCNNDVCKADGDCVTDLLGFTPAVAEQFKNADSGSFSAPVMGRNFAPESTQAISNKTGADCKNTEKPKFKPFNSTVQQNTFKNSQQNNSNPMDSIKRPKMEEIVGQVEEVERPLTMNTIVETAGHNQAAKFNKW
jgi:hypothetical protein